MMFGSKIVAAIGVASLLEATGADGMKQNNGFNLDKFHKQFNTKKINTMRQNRLKPKNRSKHTDMKKFMNTKSEYERVLALKQHSSKNNSGSYNFRMSEFLNKPTPIRATYKRNTMKKSINLKSNKHFKSPVSQTKKQQLRSKSILKSTRFNRSRLLNKQNGNVIKPKVNTSFKIVWDKNSKPLKTNTLKQRITEQSDNTVLDSANKRYQKAINLSQHQGDILSVKDKLKLQKLVSQKKEVNYWTPEKLKMLDDHAESVELERE